MGTMTGAEALAALLAAAHQCQPPASSFSDEQAAHGLILADALRASFLSPFQSAQAASRLLQLPAELLAVTLSHFDTRDLARLAATCRWLSRDATPSPSAIGPVETELRLRAGARGLDVDTPLLEGGTSCVTSLLKRDRRDAQLRQAPLAVGALHSIFVDKGGRLLTCGRGILVGHDHSHEEWVPFELCTPVPVPSMQDRRIVSVAAGYMHSLALSAEGEVYSWGTGVHGALGHGDECAKVAVPRRIESLSRIEQIAAGPNSTSAAVDEQGRLFTWGRARFEEEVEDEDGGIEEFEGPSGLGYELNAEAMHQATPKRVDALSPERVVGVALGDGFTLAVTDAGAVFSFGCSLDGYLGHGHGSSRSEVLPRRIEARVKSGHRFVAVAAGSHHSLALTEEGELYGWGDGSANGHGRGEHTPQLVTALIGQCVKLVDAQSYYSCAVTAKGELFTWGEDNLWANLGHDLGPQALSWTNLFPSLFPRSRPKRVEGLNGLKIVAVAKGRFHTLAADADGVVWAFGRSATALGLGAGTVGNAKNPTSIPTLRVRVLNSP
jgi:alpha-tubulin suppressor-like RCC1 family protein